MIVLRDVGKTYATPDGPLRAVSGVSLEIARGDIFGIIGFSGAGKSTLLRTVNLLERPDPGGRVLVDGRDLTGLAKTDLNRVRQSIGMVFQHFHLLNNRNVSDNVSLPLEFAGWPKALRLKRVRECLDIVGLTDKAGTYPAKLSGGQKQRVAIARALAAEPKVLLCDEPTSSVDPHTTESLLRFLQDLNRRFGITIVLVTHEMEAINAICNNVAVMDGGRIVEQFSLEDRSHLPQSSIARFLLQNRGLPAAPLRVVEGG